MGSPERLGRYEVGVVLAFEATHRLRGDFGPATRTHGHTYRVEVSLSGGSLADDGTLVDLGLLQGAADVAVGALHKRDLDELEPFSGRNTTAEVVAEHIHRAVCSALARRAAGLLRVRVWESDRAWAAYEAEI